MSKKISVACTVYNDEKEIINLLNDINNQTVLPNEIVIADGGSSDKTVDIIKKYEFKTHIKILEGKRLNVSEGFNVAISNTKYDIIVIMATGNRYEKNFINELIKTYNKTKVSIVFTPIRGIESTSFSKDYINVFLNNNNGNIVPSNHGVLLEKKIFTKIGLFYEYFIYAGEDTEFFLRCKLSGIESVCAFNSKSYWDIPKNYKQFRKQLKNYIIADMQIFSVQYLLHKYKRYIKLLGLFVLSLIMLALKFYFVSVLLFVIIITTLGINYYKYNFISQLLYDYKNFYQVFIMLLNLKLFKKKYHVDNNKIRKLE